MKTIRMIRFEQVALYMGIILRDLTDLLSRMKVSDQIHVPVAPTPDP
jgi:hypothetical protein